MEHTVQTKQSVFQRVMAKERSRERIRIIVTFLLIFASLFVMQKLFHVTPEDYNYSLGRYHRLGDSLFASGRLSLATLEEDFRGYVFPLFHGVSAKFDARFGMEHAIYFFGSVILAFLMTICLCFSHRVFPGKRLWLRDLVMVGLLYVFFYGLIIWPITDLYAALGCFASGYYLYTARQEEKPGWALARYAFAGLLIYITYNLRTIYLFPIFLYLIVIGLAEWRKGIGKTALSLVSYLGGGVVAAIPQFVINWQRYQTVTPWINTENLFGRQLFWGLTYSRYETFIGEVPDISAGLKFMDNAGVRIAEEFAATGLPQSVGNYIKLFFRYPVDFLSIIGKHIYNAFFVLYPEQYIENLDKDRSLLAIVSLIVVFVFAVALYQTLRQRKPALRDILLAVFMLFPGIAIVLGAVEGRFLVLIYLFVYAVIANFDYRSFFRQMTKTQAIGLAAAFVLFSFSALAVESEILSSLEGYPLTFAGLR